MTYADGFRITHTDAGALALACPDCAKEVAALKHDDTLHMLAAVADNHWYECSRLTDDSTQEV